MRVDLHSHSTCSDGSLAPEAVLELAEAAGVELYCLTDHDTCAGSAAVARAARSARILRGVEISCHEDGRTVHVLCYDTGAGDWGPVETKLGELQVRRRRRVHDMCARLEQLGIRIDPDAIVAGAAGRSVGRPDVARALVAAGAVRSMGEAFDRYLHDGGPADVPVARLSVADGLVLGRAAGARMALAHPHQHGPRAEAMVRRYRDEGLDGLEVFYGTYDAGERRRWLEVATRYDLVATAGSDFHGAPMPAVKRPGMELPEPHATRLREWLGL